MNTYFTLEPFTIPEHKMGHEYPPDLAGDSSMSTASFEDDAESLFCDFDMADVDIGTTTPCTNFGHQSSPQIVTPTLTSVPTPFQSFEPDLVDPSLDPLHQLMDPTPIEPMDASYRSCESVSDASSCSAKSAAELDQLCKEGIAKLKESMKRSSMSRQELMRQRQILGY